MVQHFLLYIITYSLGSILKNKILISTSTFQQIHSELGELKNLGFEVIFNPFRKRLTHDEASEFYSDAVVGIIAGVEPITEKLLNQALSLKVISRCGIATDNIDMNAATKRNIQVFTTPDAPSVAVAELTIGLLLSLYRKIAQADQNIKKGTWKPLMGNLLREKTLGIIGYGRIGKQVAKIAQAFEMRVCVYDIFNVNDDSVEQKPLGEIFSTSDIISLHLPYKNGLKHMINNEVLSSMKKNTVIINTSRGELIDENALVSALENQTVYGAALDVYENEPYVGPLTKFDNVILTSHMGSYAYESRINMEKEALKNLIIGLRQAGEI